MSEKAKVVLGVFLVWIVSFACGYWYASTKADRQCRQAFETYYGGR